MATSALLALSAVLVSACVLAGNGANGLPCPCAPGFVCVRDMTPEGRCVRGTDSGPLRIDTGPHDASSSEAGSFDAAVDTGGSGDLDAGLDAGLDAVLPDGAPVDVYVDPTIDAAPIDAPGSDAFAPDAFVPDAFVPDAFVPIDAGPMCPRPGNGRDDDGDGTCTGDPTPDCNDSNPAIRPGATDVCTPSTPFSRGVDEDCDTAIDEGCPYHFGLPGYLTSVAYAAPNLPNLYNVTPTSVHRGGDVIYGLYSGATLGSVRIERGPMGDVIASAAPLTIIANGDCNGLSVNDAETFGASEYSSSFCTATPSGGSWQYNVVEPMRFVSTAMGRRGDELFVSTVFDRVDRQPVGAGNVLGPAVAVITSTDVGHISLSDDGSLLATNAFGVYGPGALSVYRRTGPTTFVRSTAFDALTPVAARHLHVGHRRRELIAWGGILDRVPLRIQICRDGPCAEPEVTCPSGRTCTFSSDRRHAYFRTAAATWAAARSLCQAAGGDLVSMGPHEDYTMISAVFGSGEYWVGGDDSAVEGTFVWEDGQPFTMATWRSGEPNGSGDCLTYRSGLDDRTCADRLIGVCEVQVAYDW